VWERWRGEKDDEPLDTYTIITTTPNDVMKPLHNRMPVILDQADYEKWLDPATKPDEAKALLRPAPNDALEAYPVSTSVNKPSRDGPELIEPYDDAPLLNLRPTASEVRGGGDE
jgi:putative SOS response-associated peptidase YedK